MNPDKFGGWIRGVLVVCASALAVVLFVPLWQIDLTAPQYPEGLRMLIYSNKLGGNVDIINGLNHYIGMKTLHTEDFVEFIILPYLIGLFAVLFLLAGLLARKQLLYVLFVLFIGFALLSMVDFWRWEYNYGHDLNPEAAIVVPGMSYQPPLIGYKQLLNFGAYSAPHVGGWIFIVVAMLLTFCTVKVWKGKKKVKSTLSMPLTSASLSILLCLASCNKGPEPIMPGKDICYFCKMVISDVRFGAVAVTKKGKSFKFDDLHCLLGFLQQTTVEPGKIAATYFVNYSKPHQLIAADKAGLLSSAKFRTPMGGNIAAFDNRDSLQQIQRFTNGSVVSWNDLAKK